MRCAPTKALYSVHQGFCFCVLYEPQELCAVRAYRGFAFLCTVRAPRALRGASRQRLCASVYCTSPTSFVRCEPTKTLYSVHQGLCFCVLYEPYELCAVRALFCFVFFPLTYSRWTSSLPSCLWSQRIFPSLPGSRLTIFLSRCKFSTLTTRQPMVEFYLLTFPRFPLRKKEPKSYFGKNRTHDFRTSRCAAYLLDHSSDELQMLYIVRWRSPSRLCTECLCVRAVV